MTTEMFLFYFFRSINLAASKQSAETGQSIDETLIHQYLVASGVPVPEAVPKTFEPTSSQHKHSAIVTNYDRKRQIVLSASDSSSSSSFDSHASPIKKKILKISKKYQKVRDATGEKEINDPPVITID